MKKILKLVENEVLMHLNWFIIVTTDNSAKIGSFTSSFFVDRSQNKQQQNNDKAVEMRLF